MGRPEKRHWQGFASQRAQRNHKEPTRRDDGSAKRCMAWIYEMNLHILSLEPQVVWQNLLVPN